MSKAIICIGLPASGKSTWAKKFVHENPDYVRVNRDDIRRMRGKYWLPDQEDLITDIEQASIAAAVARGLNVIVDATNLNPTFRKNLIQDLGEMGCEITYRFFDSTLDELLERDKHRGAESVGDGVIRKMHAKYREQFGLLQAMNHMTTYIDDDGRTFHMKQLPEYSKPKPAAIIVDIDGTVATHEHRSHYSIDVLEDKPIREMVDMVRTLCVDYRIVFVTGRKEAARKPTTEWLDEYFSGMPYELYMRPDGDNSKDYLLKEDIYKAHIKPWVDVKFVLEDRTQVVGMWRRIGLRCLQVTNGDY